MMRFTKMHGLGNDFMVINGVTQHITLTPQDIQTLSHRKTGIGFDQCLIVEPSCEPNVDFNYRIFNANGTEVGQCGNGARCLARFIQQQGLSTQSTLNVKTSTTYLTLHLEKAPLVTITMPPPLFDPMHIPLAVPNESPFYQAIIDDQTIQFHAIHVGNPHAILWNVPLSNNMMKIAEALHQNPLFPEYANVSLVAPIDAHHLQLRVFERGCGETAACGSAAVAAVAVGRRWHHLSDSVTVTLPGGTLFVTWPNEAGPITLTGPAEFCYEGYWVRL